MDWRKTVAILATLVILIAGFLYPTQYVNIRTSTSLKIRPWQESDTEFLHGNDITNNTTGNSEEYEDIVAPYGHSWVMENPFTEDFNVSYIVSRLYLEPHIGSDIRVDGSMGDKAAFNISFGDVNRDRISDLIVGAPYADWPSNVTTVYNEESLGKSSYPFNADKTWVRLQMLYLKSDIPKTGIVDKIYFYKTSSGRTGIFRNFRIYLGEYSSDSLGENLDDNNNSAINKKLVYKADKFTLSGDAGWFCIDVYNIFNYTGNNNLFIQISWAGSSGETIYLKEKDRGGTNNYRAYAASGTYSNSSAKTDALQYWMKLAITPWQKVDCGATYIFFGYENWSASHLTAEDANWTLYGEMGHDYFGWSVDSLDFNDDSPYGRDDVIIGAPNASVGQIRPGKMYIFYGGRFDEFENSTPLQGWSYSSTGVTVTATKSYKGLQCLRFYDGGSSEKYAYRSIPNYDAGIVELFVNLNWTGGNFFITLKNGTSDVMKIEFRNNGFIYYYNSTGSYQLMSEGYAPNTWYWVKFDYDCGRGTYDIYLNNSLVKSGIDFINSASSVDTIDLRTAATTKVTVYVDQVITTPGYVIGVGEFDGDKYGFSVSYAGDNNYDGVDDAVVGAPGYQNNTGKSYVYFGKEATNSKSLTPTETYENSSKSNVNQNPSSLSTVKSSHNTKSVFRKKSKDDCDKKVDFLKQYESVYGRYYREGEEVMEYRTPFSRTFRMPDGTYVTILSGIATSYKDENGNWHDIDWNNPPPNIKEKLKGENDYDKYSFWYGYGYDIDWDGDDAHVYNFQSDGTYQSSSYPIMIGTDKDGRKEWSRGWIQWDTSSIPDYAHPFQVRIRLYVAYVGQWDDEWDTHAVNLEFIQMTNKPSDQGEHNGDIDNYWLYDDAADGTLYWGTHGDVSFSTAGSAHYVRVTMDPNYDTWYPSSTGWVDLGYDACDDLYNHLSSDWWAVGLHQMNEEGDDRDAWPGDPDPGGEPDEGIELFGADQYLEVRWYVPNFEDDLEPAPLDYWETSSSFAILEPWEAEDFEPQRSGAFDWWSTSGAEQVSQTATGLSALEGSYMAHLKYDKNNADYYIKINNPIDLTHTSSATLVFYYTGSSESDYDFFYFKISTDGNNWVNLLTRSGDYSDGWYRFIYDLAANGYTGNKIYVKFEFVTNGGNYGSSYGEGWYIDYFYITCDDFWHLTTDDYHSSSHSYYFGVDSIGKYTNYSIQSLFTPDIYLSTSADYITLSFWEKYDTQSSADYCEVWLHDYYDDSSHRLTYYSGSSGGWKERIIDLTSYKGHTVYIYFIFSAGPSYIYSGWWIDDIRIYGTYKITFQASTANSGTHQNMDSSNYVTVTYYRCGWQRTAHIYDGHSVTDYVDAGSSYSYTQTSSASTSTHRWYSPNPPSGTASSSTTITGYYWEQYNNTFKYTKGNGAGCTHSTSVPVTYYHEGNSDIGYATESGNWYWVDNGSTVSYANPHRGYGLDFDGDDDYVEIPDGIISNTSRYFSVGGWVLTRTLDAPSSYYDQRMIFYAGAEDGEYALYLDCANDKWVFTVHLSDGNWYMVDYSANKDVFVHIMGVRRGTTIELWINGSLANTTSIPDLDLAVTAGFHSSIGSYNRNDRSFFNGIIDEVRIYNRALSSSEISDLYQGKNVTTGLVAYWNFEEGSGNVAHDVSGNGNDGTVYGAKWAEGYGEHSTERWYSPSTTSWTITSSTTLNPTYYHQWYVTFKYTKGNGAGCTHSTSIPVTYYHEGSSDTGYATESGNSYWVDCGSTVSYTNPYEVTPNQERWCYSGGDSVTVSYTITSSTTLNPTYYHQWNVSYSITHSTNSGPISGTVRATYTYLGTTYSADLSEVSGSVWLDCGSYVYLSGVSSGTAAYRWDFNKDGDAEGWSAVNNIASFSVSGGKLNVQSSGTDPYIYSPSGLSIDASTYKYVIVRMKISPAGSGPYDSKLYFITSTDSTWNEAKSKLADYCYTDGNYHIFTFNMSSVSGWSGTVTQIRLDPLNSGAANGDWYYIDYVAVVKSHIWALQSPTNSVQRWYVDSAISITATYYEMYYPKVQTSGLDSGGSYGTYVHRTLMGTSTDSEYKIYDGKVWYGWCDANTSISVDQEVSGDTGERWYCPSPNLTSSLQNSGTYTAYYYHQYQITFKAWTKNTGPHTNMSSGNTANVTYTSCGNTYYAYPYDYHPVTVWADDGTTYSYSSKSTGSTPAAGHRWYSPNPPSGTVNSSATIVGYYWEQYAVTFEYIKGNDANCAHTPPTIPVNITYCGNTYQWVVNTSMDWACWVDNGSNYEYWYPYVIDSGDDFEGQTVGSDPQGWITNEPTGTAIEIDNTHSISGSLSVKFDDDSNSAGSYMFKQFRGISGKGVIMFYIYKTYNSTSQGWGCYFDCTIKEGGVSGTPAMEIDFRSDGYVYYYNGTIKYNYATKWFRYSANTWYLVYFIFDVSSEKYDIYVFDTSSGVVHVVKNADFMNTTHTYNSIDTIKFTTGKSSMPLCWVDDVYVAVFDNSLSSERWNTASSNATGTIDQTDASNGIRPKYYHQWKVTFKYTVGNANCTATPPQITVWYYHEGSLDKSGYATTSGQTYWVDCGSNYNYTNPYPYSPTTERWYSRDTISGQITSSITINPTYYHQWKITFGVKVYGRHPLTSTNYSTVTYKANNTWTSEHLWAQDQITRWVDCGEYVKFSEKSSSSDSSHRWYNPTPRDFYINESYHPASINEEYWEQWNITLTAHVVNTALGNKSLDSTNYVWGNYSWCSQWNETHLYDNYSVQVWVDDGTAKIVYSHTSKGSNSTHRWYAPTVTYDSDSTTQYTGIDCTYYEQYLASLSTHTLPDGAPSLNSTNYATAWITANGTNESVFPIYDDISPVYRWVDNNTYVIFKQVIYDSSNNIRWVAEYPWRHQVKSLSTRTIPQNYWCQYKNVVGVYIINDVSTFPNGVEIKYYQTNQQKYLYLGNGRRKEWAEIWADYNSQITWEEEPYNDSQKRWRIDDDATNPETVTSYGNNWTKYYYHQYYIEFRTPKNVGSCTHTPPAFSLTTRWNLGDNDGGQSGNSYWVDNNTTYQYENPHYNSSNERWYISSSNYSALVDGSYFIVQPDCYHQWNVTFKYRKMNTGCPHSVNIPFNYTYLGSTQTGYATETGSNYWVDCNSNYEYYNPYYDSSISRWKSSSTNVTGTINSAGKIEPYYYHQIKVNFIPQKGNGANCGHSLPDASNFKLNYTADGKKHNNTSFGTYWVDCGSTVEYQPYYNSTVDRWYPESLSETITSGGEHYVKFFHQWKITFSATTVNAGTPMNSSNYVTVTYTSTNYTQSVHIWDSHSETVWADCGSQFIYSQTSKLSTSQHRWRTNEALTGTVSYSTAQSGVSKNYYEQVYLTLDNGGHDTGYSEGELFGLSHSAFGPGSSWYDVGCNVTIRVDSPVGGQWIRYRFDHWIGTYTSNSNPYSFTMPSADGVNETAVWVTQYKLAVKTQGVSPPNYTAVYINGVQEGSANDNSPFYKWYDAGSSTGTIGVDDYVGGYYIRSYFKQWDDGTTNSTHESITMTSPMNLTAIYVTKYRLIVSTSGLPSSFPTKLWINGVYKGTIYDGQSYSAWYDVGASTGNITVQEIVVTGGRFDYHFVYWNDWTTNHDHPSITMNSPVTLIAKYIMGIMFNVTIVGINEGDYFGWAVSDAGNVNETSSQQPIKDDIIIGSPGWNNWQGRAYIFYGSFLKWKASQQNKSIYLRDTNANVTLVGENQGDKFGWSVSYAGDLNGDGYDDVIVGAPGYNSSQGRSYVYYGNANMDNGGSSKKERKITEMEEKERITTSIVNPNNDEVAGSYAKKLVEKYYCEIDEFTKKRLRAWINSVRGRDVGEITLPNVEKYFHKKMRDIIRNGRRPIYRIELLNESVFRLDWMNLSMDDRRKAMLSAVNGLEALKQERNTTIPYKDDWYNPQEILTLEYLAYEVYKNPENWKMAYEIIKGIKSIDDARIGPFECIYRKPANYNEHNERFSKSETYTVTLQIVRFEEEDRADDYPIFGSPGDPYFKLGVGDWTLTTGIISDDGTFNCKFIHTNSNVSGSTVSIHIEVWDSDPSSDDDDHYDISPISNDNDVDVTYDLTTKTWSGDVSNPYSQGNGDPDGDGGQVDGDIWFVIESDEDNEAKLGNYDPNYDSEPYHDGICFNDPHDSPTRVTYYSGNNYWSTFPRGVHFSYEEYEFYVSSGTTISVHMVPDDSNDNFDLYLYDPSGTEKAHSTNSAGSQEDISYTADSSGYWKIRITNVSVDNDGDEGFRFWFSSGPDDKNYLSVATEGSDYDGYLISTYNGASYYDSNDYYKIYVSSWHISHGASIYVYMKPNNNADFDLYLYDPAGNLKNSSTNSGNGQYESILYDLKSTDSSGYWYFKVDIASGYGNYSLVVWFGFRVEFHAITANSGPHEPMHSDNGVQVSYVQMGSTDYVYPNDYYYWIVYVDNGSSYSYASQSNLSGTTHRWYSNAPPNGTIYSSTSITGYYYEQYNITVNAQKGNGAGCTDTLPTSSLHYSYYSFGTQHNDGNYGSATWIDNGSEVQALDYSVSSTQRWACDPNDNSVTVTSGNTITFTYYHQWLVEFKIIIKSPDGAEPTGGVTVHYTQFGSGKSQGATATGFSDWVDCGGSYYYDNPSHLVSQTERWYSPSTNVSGSITLNITVAPFYYHQYWVTIKFTIGNDAHCSHTTAIPVSWQYLGGTNNSYAYTTATQTWVDAGSKVIFKNPYVITANVERWFSTDNASGGNVEYTISSAQTCNPTYWHQWYITVETTGGYLDATYSTKLYYNQTGSTQPPVTIYDSSPWQGWVDCGSQLKVTTPVNGPTSPLSPRNVTYVCDFPLVYVTTNGTYTFLFHAEFPADVKINGGSQGDKFGYAVDGSIVINGTVSVVIGAPGNNTIYVFYWNSSWGIGTVIDVSYSSENYSGEYSGDMYGFSVIGRNADFNDDGTYDIAVGAPYFNSHLGDYRGRAYILRLGYPEVNVSFWYTTDNGATWHLLAYYLITNLNSAGWYNSTPIYVHKTVPAGGKIAINITVLSDYGSPMVRVYYNSSQHNSHYEIKAVTLDNWHTIGSARTRWVRTYWQDGTPTNQWIARYSKSTNTSAIIKANITAVDPYGAWMISGAKIKIIDVTDGSVIVDNATMNLESQGANWKIYTYTLSLSSLTAGHRYMAVVTAVDYDGFDDWEFGFCDERIAHFIVVS